jgi:hypothetical protein
MLGSVDDLVIGVFPEIAEDFTLFHRYTMCAVPV